MRNNCKFIKPNGLDKAEDGAYTW